MISEQINNCTIIHCEKKRIDAIYAPEFNRSVCDIIKQSLVYIKAVILDLSNIEYIDSSGLGAIVLIFQKLKIKFFLCGVKGQVEKLIKATRLDSIFALHQDVASAVLAA